MKCLSRLSLQSSADSNQLSGDHAQAACVIDGIQKVFKSNISIAVEFFYLIGNVDLST